MRLLITTAYNIVIRDYRIRFRRTYLSILWFLLPMFMLAGLALFIGGELGLYSIEGRNKYIVQLLTGLILWQLFADAWLEPMRYGRRTKTVLRAVALDENALLLAGAISAMIGFIIKVPVVLVAFVWFDVTPPNYNVFIPIGMISILSVGTALSCFTLPISLILLDVRYSMPVIQFVLLLATPIFYDIPASGLIASINHYNPFTYLILPIRDIFLNVTIDTSLVLLSTIIAIIFLVIGMYYYQAKMRLSIAYIGR